MPRRRHSRRPNADTGNGGARWRTGIARARAPGSAEERLRAAAPTRAGMRDSQRAPGAVAGAPARQPRQDRDRADDRALGADGVGDHARARRGRAAAAPGAAARRVGQPSIPMSLNPEGAFFLGLKIGRRSAELVLIDFLGAVRGAAARPPTAIQRRARPSALRCAAASPRCAPSSAPSRTSASPGSASPCRSSCGTGPTRRARRASVMDRWRDRDIRAEHRRRSAPSRSICRTTPPPACGAELVFGKTGTPARLHLFLHRRLCRRRHRAQRQPLQRRRPAMPARSARCRCRATDGKPRQLIDVASIAMLEQALATRRACERPAVDARPRTGARSARSSSAGSKRAAQALAYGIVSAAAVIDFEAAIIDGWMPKAVRAALVRADPGGDRRDRCRGPQGAGGARRHRRHPCPGAGRRQPAAVGPLPHRRQSAIQGQVREEPGG